jgi:hypothetical protein
LKNHQPLGGTNHQRSMTCSSWVGELVVVDYVFVPELVPMRIGRTRPTRCSKLLQCRYQPISFGCTPSLPRSLIKFTFFADYLPMCVSLMSHLSKWFCIFSWSFSYCMLLSFKWLNHSSKFKPPPWLDDLHGENRVSPFVYHPTLYHGISGAFISMIDLFNIFQTCDFLQLC